MKLPFLSKKKEDAGFYLALLLTDEKASAVILHEELGKVKIIGQHQEFFSKSLDHVELEELIEVVDKALSRAEEALPPSIETHQTVFGVKENWVEPESKKITKHHLSQLKKVCDSLDLTPIGFMVTSEAITHLLQEEEGAPLSAIIVDTGKTGVSLTLLRGGKTIESISGPFKEFSPPMTVDMLLRHFTVPVLPARIILFDSDSGEKLSQQFIAHQWSKSLPFLHVPQVTVLPSGFDAKAVAFGAAAQMGFEMIGLTHSVPKPAEPAHTPEHEAHEPHELNEPHDKKDEEEIPEEVPEETSVVAAAAAAGIAGEGDNFGFVTGQDITDVKPATKEPEEKPVHAHEKPEHEHEPAYHTVQATHDDEHIPQHHQIQKHVEDIEENDEEEDEEEEDDEPRGKKKGALLGGLKMPNLGVGFGALGKNRKILLPVIIVVVLLIGIAALSFYYLYKVDATVELTMKPNMLNRTTQATFTAGANSNFDKNVIAASSLTATVDGESSTNATGKKDVGEKAKGTVTVFNNSDDKVTIDSGTEIKSSNGLVFLTEKDITVSSSSGDIFSGTKPGTTNVAVVAKELGTEQNLPSNTKFTIGSNATLAAKNDNAFSGGTKKSVTVVSKDDLAKLREELPKNLQSKAKDVIAKKASSDQTVLPYFATDSLEKANYDKKVDEEAKTVKLKASVVFNGMAYNNSELEEYAKSVLKRDQAGDINFADKTIKATVKEAKSKDEKTMTASVLIEGGALPNMDTSDVAKQLEGKSYGDAMDTLSSLPQIAKSDITFSPSIPFLPQIFPTLPKNITVVTKSE